MSRGPSAAARAVLIRAGVAVVIGAGAVAGLPPTLARASTGRTLMACVSLRTLDTYVFRSAPSNCVLHFSTKPFDGNDMAALGAIQWSGWGRGVARGHGIFHGNMDSTEPSTIVLSRLRRCPNGTRNYTQARITTQGIGIASGPLAACRA
jgi:hypothetical protein